jgi:hypothetical protein
MGMYARLEKRPETREELTPVVVFTAFAIEAYLNSIGARKIAFWDDLERLPWRQKASILHKAVGKNRTGDKTHFNLRPRCSDSETSSHMASRSACSHHPRKLRKLQARFFQANISNQTGIGASHGSGRFRPSTDFAYSWRTWARFTGFMSLIICCLLPAASSRLKPLMPNNSFKPAPLRGAA